MSLNAVFDSGGCASGTSGCDVPYDGVKILYGNVT